MSEPERETENIYTNLYKIYTDNMSAKNERLVYPVDLTEQATDLKLISEKLGISKAEAIRESLKHYAEQLRGIEVVTYRDVGRAQAKKEVERYLRGKDRVWTDEISDALRLEPGLVNEVLMELWKVGLVEPK